MTNKLMRSLKSPLMLLYVVPIILLSESLFTGRVLFWGTPSLQFIPWRAYAYDALLRGEIPLWNSLNGMGTPLLANYQLALFYPPSWLLILLYKLGSTPWMAWGHTLLAVMHLVWAGFGMAKFVKRLGFEGELNQIISGLSYSLGGYIVARIGFFSILWTAAWIPWILLLVSNIVLPDPTKNKKWWSYYLLVGAVTLQLLAGHAQLSWYTLILAFAWLVICSLGKTELRRIF